MFHCPYEGCSQVYVAISSFQVGTPCFSTHCVYSTEQCPNISHLFLQNHVNLVHRKGRTKVCPHPGCGKKFYLSNHLHRHMIIHSGESQLITHQPRRQSSDNDNWHPVRCKVGGAAFGSPVSQQKGQGFKANLCGGRKLSVDSNKKWSNIENKHHCSLINDHPIFLTIISKYDFFFFFLSIQIMTLQEFSTWPVM